MAKLGTLSQQWDGWSNPQFGCPNPFDLQNMLFLTKITWGPRGWDNLPSLTGFWFRNAPEVKKKKELSGGAGRRSDLPMDMKRMVCSYRATDGRSYWVFELNFEENQRWIKRSHRPLVAQRTFKQYRDCCRLTCYVLFFFFPSTYFSPRRGLPTILNFCMPF